MSKATLKTWTIDEMLAEHPCSTYTRERITELWAGRERLSAADFLALPIPDADKVWACLHDRTIAALATPRIVERAVRAHARHCGVPAVEQWAARWLDGTDRSRKKAKRAAAAAWAAAWAAAEEAARAAAKEAARAAWAAAWAVARVARMAQIAERSAQLDDIRVAIAEMGGRKGP